MATFGKNDSIELYRQKRIWDRSDSVCDCDTYAGLNLTDGILFFCGYVVSWSLNSILLYTCKITRFWGIKEMRYECLKVGNVWVVSDNWIAPFLLCSEVDIFILQLSKFQEILFISLRVIRELMILLLLFGKIIIKNNLTFFRNRKKLPFKRSNALISIVYTFASSGKIMK